MYQVHIGSNTSFFKFLKQAKEFAKMSGMWYYIATDEGIVRTQDDDILDLITER